MYKQYIDLERTNVPTGYNKLAGRIIWTNPDQASPEQHRWASSLKICLQYHWAYESVIG
jgi:hypothetical protein